MKKTYVKHTITTLAMAAAMAFPMTAMAAEAAASPASPAPAAITQAEKQELDNACRKLEQLEAELDKLLEAGKMGSECDSVESQMAPLRLRIVELMEKETPGISKEAFDPLAYVKELKLSADEKKELSDAYKKLDELEGQLEKLAEGSKEYNDIDSQIASVEKQIAGLEDKAFPIADDSVSYEEYVKDLDLTDAEKKDLVDAYKAEDSAKIAALEMKAAVNSMAKLAGGEKQEYIDAANQLKALGDEMAKLILSNAPDGQLEQLAQKMEPLYDRLMELEAKA